MKYLKVIFLANVFFFLYNDIWAQTYNDGPMRLRIRIDQVYIDSYQDAGFGEQEITWKFWARADQDINGTGWNGGQCITYDTWNYGWVYAPYTTILDQTYTGTTVPSRFDLYIDAWEDDRGSRCSFDGSCFLCDGDDYHCGPGEFASDINYRNYGPPCQWNNAGNFYACSGSYGAQVSVYWEYTGNVNGTYTWKGNYSTNWFDACNWSTSTVPSTTKDVVIPSGTTYSPLINSGSAYCNTIEIQDGALLTINSDNGAVLNVAKP